jgi:hypothetical protein
MAKAMEFSSVEPIIQKICDGAVRALGRFCNLTDMEPQAMHESFMASYVFDRLGRKISMAPEVTVSTLWKWNRTDNNIIPPMPTHIEKKRKQRIDLTLFTPQNVQKEYQHIWALIEFKRNYGVDRDYEKLRALLPFFDGCDFGVACGVVDAEKHHDWLAHEEPEAAAGRGERFVTSALWKTVIEGRPRSFVVFAHLFTAPS